MKPIVIARNAGLVTLALAAFAARAEPIAESFERMLVHPSVAAPVARPAEPADPLLHALVIPLRDGTAAPSLTSGSANAPSRAGDPIVASFERMLSHPPTVVASPVPAGADPLVAALVEPLRDGPSRLSMRVIASRALP